VKGKALASRASVLFLTGVELSLQSHADVLAIIQPTDWERDVASDNQQPSYPSSLAIPRTSCM
jgi:hypothetical protein